MWAQAAHEANMARCNPIVTLGIAVLACILLFAGGARSQTRPDAARPLVLVADIDGAIGPATTRFIEQSIAQAEERNAEALVLRIDTPGGLVTSMRDIISAILAANVPVIGYVGPPGAQAASAGTYLMYATHVAAMAPGTNMGAATPIQIGGFPGSPSPKPTTPEDKESKEKEAKEEKPRTAPENAMEAKAVNDAVAFIRSLAELRGRNVEWAEKAVREAASVSADHALTLKIIDIQASDLNSLLQQLDARSVVINGNKSTLYTANAAVEHIEPGTLTRILGVLTNPNIAFILMLVGIYGLIFELASPGTFGPGVIGAISLVLGLYALNQLPIDYAGLILVIIGVAFMVAEAFTPTFGILGIGGLIAFIIGATFLIDTDVPHFQLSWNVIIGAGAASGALLVFGLGYAWRSVQQPVRTGLQHLTGTQAEVLDWSGREGWVWIAGERWRARGDDVFSKGDVVTVKAAKGLTLVVSRA